MTLPTDDKGRKALPVFRGPLMYFPDAILAIAAVCKAGNDQYNPGQPLHWAREKSTEQMDTALRHMMDHGMGNTKDVDGTYHLAKAAWRLLAELQLTIEKHLAAEEDIRLATVARADAFARKVDEQAGPIVEAWPGTVPGVRL
jgi:hypothetical protein